MHRCAADAASLITRIDHKAPEADLWLGRRRGEKRLIFEHEESNRVICEINAAVPRFRSEQRLCKRDRVGCNKALLIWRDRK
ncbi:hypothetical protein AYO41_04270 [Verrucomicrobia bacterium SCGC AG-212-E04]|nr:hypothetical protein AYO41_04270 [Verrucomicrobia bacterium SCGC AG-212-E04]